MIFPRTTGLGQDGMHCRVRPGSLGTKSKVRLAIK